MKEAATASLLPPLLCCHRFFAAIACLLPPLACCHRLLAATASLLGLFVINCQQEYCTKNNKKVKSDKRLLKMMSGYNNVQTTSKGKDKAILKVSFELCLLSCPCAPKISPMRCFKLFNPTLVPDLTRSSRKGLLTSINNLLFSILLIKVTVPPFCR